jgi:hypothetical protein
MLSKFKKLFRASITLSPTKEKGELQPSQSDSSNTKKKEKGKRKASQTDVGDVVETQNQCPQLEEVELVENEFEEQSHDAAKYPIS